MTSRYLQTVFTPDVKNAQTDNGSRAAYQRHDDGATEPDALGENEAAFIAARDSFYLASVGATGWPYVQHRGGPKGFVKILGARTIGLADYRGNRQYVSVGNVASADRVSLFFMDYPARARLKLLGRMRVVTLAEAGALAERLIDGDYKAKIERFFIIEVEAFDWNCSQHITPRFTMEDIEPAMDRLKARTVELEDELARLKTAMDHA
jgi:predicted pyridoxine 5'-phosphate oxidase superfamily flavin-nucleotide-binding protein